MSDHRGRTRPGKLAVLFLILFLLLFIPFVAGYSRQETFQFYRDASGDVVSSLRASGLIPEKVVLFESSTGERTQRPPKVSMKDVATNPVVHVGKVVTVAGRVRGVYFREGVFTPMPVAYVLVDDEGHFININVDVLKTQLVENATYEITGRIHVSLGYVHITPESINRLWV